MTNELGLTRRKLPLRSTTRMRSSDVSKIRSIIDEEGYALTGCVPGTIAGAEASRGKSSVYWYRGFSPGRTLMQSLSHVLVLIRSCPDIRHNRSVARVNLFG